MDGRFEKFLPEIGARLADHHKRGSPRYWRIVLGKWLLRYLHFSYGRFVLLREAARSGVRFRTAVVAPSSWWVPNDTADFTNLAIQDHEYNLQSFSSHVLGGLRAKYEPLLVEVAPKPPPDAPSGSIWIRELVAECHDRVVCRLFRKRAAIAAASTYFGKFRLWELSLKSGFRIAPLLFRPRTHLVRTFPPLEQGVRQSFEKMPRSDAFEEGLVASLPTAIPRCFLEDFDQYLERARAKNLGRLAVVWTAEGWVFSEELKIWMAEHAERGAKIVGSQHGGGYGIQLDMQKETFERRTSDCFVTWGWGDGVTSDQKNLPSLKLSTFNPGRSIRSRAEHSGRSRILLVTNSYPRYPLRLASLPIGHQYERYLEYQFEYIDRVWREGAADLRVRAIRQEFGWAVRRRIDLRFNGLPFDHCSQFSTSVDNSELVVVDHMSTAFLETLSAGIPTLLFWDPSVWRLRDSARPYFDDLVDAGVLYYDAATASETTLRIGDQVWDWWTEKHRQRAVRRLVNRFALRSHDATERWLVFLEQVSGGITAVEQTP